MSMITSVVVVSSFEEDAAFAAINGWLTENDQRKQQLAVIDTSASGGSKVPCVGVWVAGFNYLDVYGFTAALRAAPWESPEQVIAYIDGESCGVFAVSPVRPDDWKLGASWMESYVRRS